MTAVAAEPRPDSRVARKLDFLDSKHPIFDKWQLRWIINERRLRGGDHVLVELHAFDWEVEEGEANYKHRVGEATYLNFPEMYLTTMSGHLLRESPVADADLNFGTLGKVVRAEGVTDPSLAELMFYNIDNAKSDGSQWNNFWFGAWRRAGATGHRWMFVEAPSEPSVNRADWLTGKRPWVVEWSPTKVSNWNIDERGLMWMVVRTSERKPRVNDKGGLDGNKGARGYLLLVRAGVTDLGTDYQGGGWWLFDSDKNPGDSGDWVATNGEIPCTPLFYERDQGLETLTDETTYAAMSRPGTTELGQLAISYMNIASAGDFDVWDSAKSITWLPGVDQDSFTLAMQKKQEGARYLPLKVAATTVGGATIIPQVVDSGAGADGIAQQFKLTLDRKLQEAEWLAIREASSTLDASGIARQLGFIEGKSPRLALAATELEQTQNSIIRWLEMRAQLNVAPTGSVSWTKTFDLEDSIDSIKKVFDLERAAGIASATLHKIAMSVAVKQTGLVTKDADIKTIENEYQASSEQKQKADAAARDAAAAFGLQ